VVNIDHKAILFRENFYIKKKTWSHIHFFLSPWGHYATNIQVQEDQSSLVILVFLSFLSFFSFLPLSEVVFSFLGLVPEGERLSVE